HVDPNEVSRALRPVDDPLEVFPADLGSNVMSELRQLHGDLAIHASLRDTRYCVAIMIRHPARFRLVFDVFTEIGQHSTDAELLKPCRGIQCRREILTRHEPRNRTPRKFKLRNPLSKPLTL